MGGVIYDITSVDPDVISKVFSLIEGFPTSASDGILMYSWWVYCKARGITLRDFMIATKALIDTRLVCYTIEDKTKTINEYRASEKTITNQQYRYWINTEY